MTRLRLIRNNGTSVPKRRTHKRPFWAYYYRYGEVVGYDIIGRATERHLAVAAAVRKVIKEGYVHVDIYLDDDALVASISAVRGNITIKLRN